MKVSKLKKFDAAEHLRTPEARADYLTIVLADGDPAEVSNALNLVARAQGMSEVAKAAGVTTTGNLIIAGHSKHHRKPAANPTTWPSSPLKP
jgi:DNA-binding phage protein